MKKLLVFTAIMMSMALANNASAQEAPPIVIRPYPGRQMMMAVGANMGLTNNPLEAPIEWAKDVDVSASLYLKEKMNVGALRLTYSPNFHDLGFGLEGGRIVKIKMFQGLLVGGGVEVAGLQSDGDLRAARVYGLLGLYPITYFAGDYPGPGLPFVPRIAVGWDNGPMARTGISLGF